jgi:hypothetical protein
MQNTLFLAEKRRLVGGWELIDSELSHSQPVDSSVGACPVEFRWDWSYLTPTNQLRTLYEKGKSAQWNPERDLDWKDLISPREFPVRPEGSLAAITIWRSGGDKEQRLAAVRDELAWQLSQLLHGEQAALMLCAQLVNSCPDIDQKQYAAIQVADEARHCETFSKLLERNFGEVLPISPSLKSLFDTILASQSWIKKCLGMQLLVESIALGMFNELRRVALSPLLAQALERIAADESRHCAFGMLSLRSQLGSLTTAELADLEDFAYPVVEYFHTGRLLEQLRAILPKYNIDPENAAPTILSARDRFARQALVYRGTIANLFHLGLITERTRLSYARLGLANAI